MARRTHGASRAYSRNSTLVLVLLAVVGIYVSVVLVTPRVTAYRMKNAVRRTCTSYMNSYFFGQAHTNWEQKWEEERRKLKVPLLDDQWAFSVTQDCDRKTGCTCTGLVAFELVTPWYLLDDYFEIPKYRSTHEMDIEVDWITSY